MKILSAKYAELLSIRIEQPFYTNSLTKKYSITPDPDFMLLPSSECLDLMKRLDYVCRTTPENAGLIILSRVLGKNGEGNDLLRFKPAPGSKLSFWMVLRNHAVINFNQLPVALDKSKIFYFSNQVTDAGALRSNLHLAAAPEGVDEATDTIKKMGAAYQFHHGAAVAASTAVVKHSITGIEVEPTSITNQSASSELYFNLSTLPQGQCKLFINHIEEDIFYYMGTSVPQQVFGVIELVLSHTIDANFRIAEPDKSLTAERPLFTVRFVNRATFWRYTLELTANSPLFVEMNALPDPDKEEFIERLNIVTNDTDITFKKLPSAPGDTTFQFVSNEALSLQEKYFTSSGIKNDTLSLTLAKHVGIPEVAAIKTNLQCPSTGAIDALDISKIYSDVLLTI